MSKTLANESRDTPMSADECAHVACTCAAAEGEYCSDYCREHSGSDDATCACGHSACVGMRAAEATG